MDLITTHLNADFDGLASMVAARKLYPGAGMVFPGGAQETVRHFLAVHDLGIAKLKDVDLTQVTRLIVVDTHEPERIGPLSGLCDNPRVSVHIYDHHARRLGGERQAGAGACTRADLHVLEPVGATTTLMVERVVKQGLPLTPFEATVLAIGLYEETGSLAYVSTTPRDLEAAAHLLRAGADLNVVADMLRHPLNPELIALLDDLLRSGETYYVDGRKVLLAASAYDRYHGDLAEAVQKLAELEALDAVLAAIAMDDKIQVIGRSRRPEIDVSRIAEEFGGGGHPEAAAASVKGKTLVEVKERLARLLHERYRPTLLARDVMTKPVKTIEETATVADTEARMTRYGVNVLPVLDRKERYLGLAARESVQKALYHAFAQSPIRSFIQTDQYTAEPETPFRDIEARMLERNQRFVPILVGSRVVGVITRTDLLRTLHDDVLASARARAKGEASFPHAHGRNVCALLKERLPERVFARLEEIGKLAVQTEVFAFVVGGFVRDLLLGRANLDLDIVIEGDGMAFARTLGQAAGARVKLHERFGTAVVVFPDGFKLDVATARTEYYEYPTALPTVEQSSIKKDLYRRDFTINTLAVRLNTRQFGELLDFYGGQRDLKEGAIRVLHSLSFVEDPTRVFRAVRFEQRFQFRLGKETLALIKGAAKMDLFHRLSGQRLLDELVLLFSEEEPRQAVARLGELDLLRFIHPALKWSSRLAALLKGADDALDWYRLLYLGRTLQPWLVYFMVLMEVLPPKAVGEILKRLSMPGREAEKIRASRASSNGILRRLAKRPPPRPADTYRVLHGLPDETLLLLMAESKSEQVKREISAYLLTYRRVRPAMTGDDLKGLGLKPGPRFREILERLLEARLNGEVTTDGEERTLAKHLVGA